MKTQTEHIDDLVEGYALNALEPAERAQVEQHVAVCPPCERMLRAIENTAHMLGFVARPVAPPQHCKRQLLEKIERERFLATPTRPARGLGAPTVWAAVAAVALVMLSGAWSMRLQQQLARTRDELIQARNERSTAQTEVAQMHSQMASVQNASATMQSQIAEFTGLEDTLASTEAVRTLQGRGTAATAAAKTYMKPGSKTAVLIIKNLPPLPANKAYQVWVARGNEQQPLTVFQASEPVMYVKLTPPEPIDRYQAIMVTVEDASGAQKPSSDTVLFGNL